MSIHWNSALVVSQNLADLKEGFYAALKAHAFEIRWSSLEKVGLYKLHMFELGKNRKYLRYMVREVIKMWWEWEKDLTVFMPEIWCIVLHVVWRLPALETYIFIARQLGLCMFQLFGFLYLSSAACRTFSPQPGNCWECRKRLHCERYGVLWKRGIIEDFLRGMITRVNSWQKLISWIYWLSGQKCCQIICQNIILATSRVSLIMLRKKEEENHLCLIGNSEFTCILIADLERL